VPPAKNPEPSLLHVAMRLPLQPAAFGVQTWALHVVVVASQYCDAVHVAVVVSWSPSESHVRTVLPEHRFVLGVQIWATQEPFKQEVPGVQVAPGAEYPEPSALHVVGALPLHTGAFGVHT
jgi:hypothetical protein